MKKEPRYLIRLAKMSRSQPTDCQALTQQVQSVVTPFGAEMANLRVSSQAIEFDLFPGSEEKANVILTRLEAQMGPILTQKRLDGPSPSPSSSPIKGEESQKFLSPGGKGKGEGENARVMAEAVQLFNEERFWEVHEVLEVVWKNSRGKLRDWLQGLILVAAAFVHLQKSEQTVALELLGKASAFLNEVPEHLEGFPAGAVVREVAAMRQVSTLHPFKIGR